MLSAAASHGLAAATHTPTVSPCTCDTERAAAVSAQEKSATGLVGLVNLGNTCYMNSVLQALFSLPGFRRRVLRSTPGGAAPALQSCQRLFAYLRMSERAAVEPEAVYRHGRPDWFPEWTQQDSSEFFKYFVDKLQAEYRSIPEAEPEHDPTITLHGMQNNITECHECRGTFVRREEFNDLGLPISQSSQPGKLTIKQQQCCSCRCQACVTAGG